MTRATEEAEHEAERKERRSRVYGSAAMREIESERPASGPIVDLARRHLDERGELNERHHRESVELQHRLLVERGKLADRAGKPANFDENQAEAVKRLSARQERERDAMKRRHVEEKKQAKARAKP